MHNDTKTVDFIPFDVGNFEVLKAEGGCRPNLYKVTLQRAS